jgi:hypothetical protein
MGTAAEEVRQGADAAVRRLKYWLEGIQYKPGWTFTAFLHEHELGKVMIRIEAKLLNAYDASEKTDFGINRFVPYIVTTSALHFKLWLSGELQGIEHHESLEWFRNRNGKPIFDPHADNFSDPGGLLRGKGDVRPTSDD